MFLLGFAGARIVTTLVAEAALTTAALLGGLQLVEAVLMLFPLPTVLVAKVIFIPLAGGFNRSLETPPLRTPTVLPLGVCDLNVVFLCEIFHTLVALFEAWATTAIVSVASAALALVLSCHNVSLSH